MPTASIASTLYAAYVGDMAARPLTTVPWDELLPETRAAWERVAKVAGAVLIGRVPRDLTGPPSAAEGRAQGAVAPPRQGHAVDRLRRRDVPRRREMQGGNPS